MNKTFNLIIPHSPRYSEEEACELNGENFLKKVLKKLKIQIANHNEIIGYFTSITHHSYSIEINVTLCFQNDDGFSITDRIYDEMVIFIGKLSRQYWISHPMSML